MDIKNIKKYQREYESLLKKYEAIVFNEELSSFQIARIIDIVDCFWLDKLNIIEYELEQITYDNDCFLLSGVIYLDIESNEHYSYKTLADYHFLYDPLHKLRNFFRGVKIRSEKENIDLFKRTYKDTLKVLELKKHFFILPISLMVIKDEHSHVEMIRNFYLNSLGSFFDKEFTSFDELFQSFNNYDEIENSLNPNIKEALLIDDEYIFESIETFIKYYFKKRDMLYILDVKSEIEQFSLIIEMQLMQILDILFCSIALNLSPAIRNADTFSYFNLVKESFGENAENKKLIDNAIIFYIFYLNINKKELIKKDFDDYCKELSLVDYIKNIKFEMAKDNIDFSKNNGISKLESIIKLINSSRDN